ncbi:MAG: redoxin domain-containing protein [Cyclobacteriaceae bacterium]|nr:redoxin domain-containing protein [Cyclobacteriaceae bacterium]
MRPVFILFLMASLAAQAQTINNFTLTNVTNNKKVSLADYNSSTGVLIIFTSNTCPFDRYYTSRIQAIAETYSNKIPVLLINSYTENEESIAAMKAYAQQENLTLPYLADKDQAVLSQFNSRKSPEAFLVKRISGKFTVVYRGAIDDNPQSAEDVINNFLKDAIDQLLAGEKIENAETRPVGCNIRRN